LSYQLEQVVGPAVEPLSILDAKNHLRVDVPDDDALIGRLLVAMRQSAETRLRRALLTQTLDLILDVWPYPLQVWTGRVLQTMNMPPTPRAAIVDGIKPPLQSVVQITYLDATGATQTVDPSVYRVITGTPGAIFPHIGKAWPAVNLEPGCITVRYICGFTDPADDRLSCVKAWMLVNLGTYYENRESVITGTIVNSLPGSDALLAPLDWGAY
jgi:uncharacterized phiE125 gp8 family phage protein